MDPERVRLLAVELAGLQEEGDILVRSRQDSGASDSALEALMLRLARARERLTSSISRDR